MGAGLECDRIAKAEAPPMTLRKCNSLPIPFQSHRPFAVGPNRRAQERERAAAQTAAKANRAEAERKNPRIG
jgi:hypothetical protein